MISNKRLIIAIICGTAFVIIFAVTIFILLLLKWMDDQSYAIARKKCYEYIQFACEHPVTENISSLSHIMGGQDAAEGMFPHLACMKMAIGESASDWCAGTLISEKFILTAAHCVSGLKESQIAVKLGSVYCTMDGTERSHRVKNIIPYGSYHPDAFINDIALLELQEEVTFSPYMRPICLSTIFDYGRKNITVSGWGSDQSNHLPGKLQVVETYVDERVLATCMKQFKFETHPTKICSAHPTQRKSACKGDSGGPLQVLIDDTLCPNIYKQIGITSHDAGVNCSAETNEPHVVAYTKVQPYVPWIVKQVWPELLKNYTRLSF